MAGDGTIITFTSDFGLRDAYAAEVKAAIWRVWAAARIVDVTHLIGRGDVLAAGMVLERALRAFGAGTIHLAVVDPTVGTDRGILVARINEQVVICPDNGLITWPWRRLGGQKCGELVWRPVGASATFHGRDIMGPAAAMLARGDALSGLCRAGAQPLLLEVAPAEAPLRVGRVIHVDGFGNATTNVTQELYTAAGGPRVRVAGYELGPVRRTYADVASGDALALVGSGGLVEIAVRDGSAAEVLGVVVGQEVLFG